MSPLDWFKKEKPLQGLTGLWGGISSHLTGGLADIPYEATGGTTTNWAGQDGNTYKIHTFTSSGQFTVQTAGTGDLGELQVFLAGGGGGGAMLGGGGGGGGCVVAKASEELITTGTYAITIGDGGEGNTGWTSNGTEGQSTIFNAPGPAGSQVVATGGGCGQSFTGSPQPSCAGANAGGRGWVNTNPDARAIVPCSIPGQWTNTAPQYMWGAGAGYQGGNGATTCDPCSGGGGGGAGGAGTAKGADGNEGGAPRANGGTGARLVTWYASSPYWGGGGGGDGYSAPQGNYGGNGGAGGGGGGATDSPQTPGIGVGGGQTWNAADGGQGQAMGGHPDGGSGSAGSGGGGGAGSNGGGNVQCHGGDGGKGFCMIRYIVD